MLAKVDTGYKIRNEQKKEAISFYFETASAKVNYLVAFSRCLLRN